MSDATRSEWIIDKTEASGSRGMVTADHPMASAAALKVLEEGGNAVDAAVTAAYVMGVTEPGLSGIGGVATMVIRLPDGRETVIDGSGLAPAAAKPDMFRPASGTGVMGMYGWPAVEGDANNVGYLSAGVPGMVAATALALERYGTIPLARAIEPAIALATEGIEVDWHVALTFTLYAERLGAFPESKRTFYKDSGLPYRPPSTLEGGGDRMAMPDLARSLRTIAAEGPDALYRGSLTKAIVEDVRRGGGIISSEDLAAYRARELPALTIEHQGHHIATNPECGGGITVAEMLNILDGFDLRSVDRGSATYYHLVAEACRAAFIDRFEHLGDPAQVDAPFELLASREHAETVRKTIDRRRRGPTPAMAGIRDVPNTTHMCAVDSSRMCISLTSTLGGAFGSAAVIRGTGILLANVMTWFDPRPGRPNAIAGGKRILWAPSPAIITRNGKPRLAVGGSGGRRLISGVAGSILDFIGGDGPQRAVNGLRVHDEGGPTLVDARIPRAVRDELTRMGHQVVIEEETLGRAPFGRMNAIEIDGDRLRGGVGRMRVAMAEGL